MNRELKFRAWDGEKMKPAPILNEGKYYTVEWGTLDYPVMQYTGIKDKNGTEIYEGDIIRDTLTKLISSINFGTCLRYGFTGWYAHAPSIDRYSAINGDYDTNTNSQVEIVGNIYQTAELLTNQTTNAI